VTGCPIIDRLKRVEQNEELFRALNEQIEDRVHIFKDDGMKIIVVCECGDLNRADRISITLETYEAVRANKHDFLLRPGHQIPDVEEVVYRSPDYFIVRKPDV